MGKLVKMKRWIICGFTLVLTSLSNAEFINGESISDPEKIDICVSRATSKTKIKEGFLINSKFVDVERRNYPDAVFAAINPENPQLVTCYTRKGTGRFEPASYYNSSNKSYWRVIRPENPVDINLLSGQRMVAGICKTEVLKKINPQDIKNISINTVNEVNRNAGVRYPIGFSVNNVKAVKYDVISDGRLILNSSSNGIDNDVKEIKCLLDYSFKIKSIEIKAP